MTKLQLYSFQREAVDCLIQKVRERNMLTRRLQYAEFLLLIAGTGVGKTASSAAFVDELETSIRETLPAGESLGGIVYFFLAPNTLHTQAHDKYVEYGLDTKRKLLLGDEVLGYPDGLPSGTVVFLNSPSINRSENNLVNESDFGPALGTIVNRTKAAGNVVVLIVDEVHVDFAGKQTQAAVAAHINPDLILGMTATPDGIEKKLPVSPNGRVEISSEQARVEGQIVQATLLNDAAARYSEEYARLKVPRADRVFLNENSDFGVFTYAAATKRDELQVMGVTEGIVEGEHNLLSAYQLPDNVKDGKYTESIVAKAAEVDSAAEEENLARVLETLRITKGWTVESGEVAIWMATNKTHDSLAEIADEKSPVKALIFKAAIALGFDARRLVSIAFLRDVQSEPFGRQVLGRATRALKSGTIFTEVEELNYAYAYTYRELMVKIIQDDKSGLKESSAVIAKKRFADFMNEFSFSPKNFFNRRENQNTLKTEAATEAWEQILARYPAKSERAFAPFAAMGFEKKFVSTEMIPQGKVVDLDEDALFDSMEIDGLAGFLNARTRILAHEIAGNAGFAGNRSTSSITETWRNFAKARGIEVSWLHSIIHGSEKNRVRMVQLWREQFPDAKGTVTEGDSYTVQPAGKWNTPASQMLFGATMMDPLYYYEKREVSLGSQAEIDFAASVIPLLHEADCGFMTYFKAPARGKESLAIRYNFGKARLMYPDWFLFYQGRILILETKSFTTSKPNPTEIVAKAAGLEDFVRKANYGVEVHAAVINLSAYGPGSSLSAIRVVNGDGTDEDFGAWLTARNFL